MLKAILFCAILAYLSGVQAKKPRSNNGTSIDIETPRAARNPDTWINAENSFFRRISSRRWDEFDRNGRFVSRFDVLASDFDRNGDLVLLLRKDDRNFVFLTEGKAYFGSVSEGRFFEFASGVWGDRNRDPINSGEVRSGQNSTHQACTVRVTNGKISYEVVGSDDLATDDDDSKRLEVWTDSEVKSNLFVHYRPKLWVQFNAGKPEKTFAEITRDTNLIGLKNNDPNAGNHSFVGLDSSNAYRGPTEKGLKQYATGSFSYLVINETNFDGVGSSEIREIVEPSNKAKSQTRLSAPWWCNAAVTKCDGSEDPCCAGWWGNPRDACRAACAQCGRRCNRA